MQVKSIHFIETIPGQPIYEMSNGDIRIPFPTGHAIVWLSFDEAVKSILDKSEANMKILMDQFNGIRLQIKNKGLEKVN